MSEEKEYKGSPPLCGMRGPPKQAVSLLEETVVEIAEEVALSLNDPGHDMTRLRVLLKREADLRRLLDGD